MRLWRATLFVVGHDTEWSSDHRVYINAIGMFLFFPPPEPDLKDALLVHVPKNVFWKSLIRTLAIFISMMYT